MPQVCIYCLRRVAGNIRLIPPSNKERVLRHIVYGMRTLRKGHAGAIKFCSLRNMPQFPAAKKYPKNLHAITSVCGPLQWKA